MLFYEGLSCPVCNKPFNENDTIVSCPQCGLPHHRDCWQQIGHCYAANRHNTEQQWHREAVPKKEEPTPTKEATRQEECSEYKPFSQYEQSRPHFDNNDTIDGISANDYAVVIGQKADYYIPRFQRMATDNGDSWNWAAFFFGPYWLIYRKMYVGGILLLLMNLFQTVVNGFVISQLNITDTQQLYDAFYALFSRTITDKTQLFYLLSIWILSAIILVINILLAVFANRLYQRHCVSVISKARLRVPDLSAPELMGIGGTTIGVVLIIGVLMSFVEQLLSILFV